MPASKAPAGSFDPAAAARGQAVFSGAANCASCHSGDAFTDAAQGKLHPAQGTSVANDQDYVKRSATQQWRTSPLPGIGYRASLGEKFFHDGSADNLAEVVDMYNARKNLSLSAAQKSDLVEYLKSL